MVEFSCCRKLPTDYYGKEVLRMVSFLWAVVTGVLASIIAHYVCKAMDRYLGSKKN